MTHKRNGKIVTPKDEWGTPVWLWHLLRDEYNLVVDAACTPENALTSVSMGADSLTIPWVELFGKVGFYLNPPYSAVKINAFMKKAYEESLKGATVVCLVPVSGDRWWIDYALKAQEIRYIRGRVKFVGYDEEGNRVNGSPMFSSCVVIFDKNRSSEPHWYGHVPTIGQTIEQPKKA
jgi:site-specific DNA-methyltransferase (adenine-specific)